MAEQRLEVEMVLDTTRAEQQAEAFAARHNRLNVTPGALGPEAGQASRVPTSYAAGISPREQAAVDRAMAMAQMQSARYGGGYASAAGASSVGGFGAAIRVDTGSAETALRRLEALARNIRQLLSQPITMNVNGAAAAVAMSQVTGGGGFPLGASSPNWGTLMQGAVQNAMYPEGAASPNWSYLMRGRGSAAAPAPRGRGFLGAAGLARTLIASEVIGEASNALQVSRQATSDAMFARSDADRSLIYAQAAERTGNGIIARALTFPLDLVDAPLSPARMLREAGESVKLRASQDEMRGRLLDIADSRAVRAGYATGGRTGADFARAEAASSRKVDELSQRANDLNARLNARTPVRRTLSGVGGDEAMWVTSGGDYELTGTARTDAQQQYSVTQRELKDARDQALFESRRRVEELADRRRGVAYATRRANMIAAGASARDVEWADLGAEGIEGMVAGYRQQGWQGLREAGGLAVARGQAVLAGRARQDEFDSRQLGSAILADTYRAGGASTQAALVEIGAQFDSFINTEQRGQNRPDILNQLRRARAARIQSYVAETNRGVLQSSIQLGAMAAGLSAQLADNPLGAQISAIRGSRDAALVGIEPGVIGSIRRFQIQQNADLQERLAVRNDERARSDTSRRLAGAQERADLAIRGGPLAAIGSAISSLVEDTEMDIRGFNRAGPQWAQQVDQRRKLAMTQLGALKAQYFRSFTYQEANPLSVVGSGDLSGVNKAFMDGRGAIGKAGNDGVNGGGSGWSPAKVDQLIDAVLTIVRDGVAAVAG